MLVWFFKLSEFTPWDVEYYGERKFRYTMLAEALVARGHEVLWWTDDFQHFKKDRGHRFGRDYHEEVSPGISVRWVYSPGYSRNVSRKRFADHRIVAERMLADVDNWPRPDLILGAMPTDSMSQLAVTVGKKMNLPVVLDVRDQWPDIFYSQVPSFTKPLIWLLCRRMDRSVKRSFSEATAVVGNTDAFVEWGSRKGRRQISHLDRSFPIGYSESSNEDHDSLAARSFWRDFALCENDGSFKVCFLGAFSKMYDFTPLLEAAEETLHDKVPVKFVLCGDGPHLERVRRSAKEIPNIVFPGRIAANEIHALLEMSSAGIIPYIDHDNFGDNIANKPAEYLSADLPILISINGYLTSLLDEYGCGWKYDGAIDLVGVIRRLRDDEELYREQAEGAKRLFRDKLDAERIYPKFAEHLEHVLASFSES